MKVICDCGEEMDLIDIQPGHDSNFVTYECPKCKSSMVGEHKPEDE